MNTDGSIVENANDDSSELYEPHYQVIERPDQVQIYETILVNSDGQVTTTLLRTAGYLKDNRLLPAGFDTDTSDARIAVHGGAQTDPDFVGGSDTVLCRIDVDDVDAPLTIEVELLYQPAAYRWTHDLDPNAGTEIERFIRFRDAVANSPVVIANTSLTVD